MRSDELDSFSLVVRERDSRWRVEENGESVAAFPDIEDAVPLALSYAQARADAGNPSTVFLKLANASRVRLARFGH